MSKKKNNISINTLEKYCKQKDNDNRQVTLQIGEDETVVFEVKPLLSLEESMLFIEEVVNESIMADDMLVIPLARDFILRKNLMTYYANFTMPSSQSKAYDLVMSSGEIIKLILENIDQYQFSVLQSSIDERIAFEEKKMIAEQTNNVKKITEEVSAFISKMFGLFEGIDETKMTEFVTGMSKMAQNTKITAQDLASAFLSNKEQSEN